MLYESDLAGPQRLEPTSLLALGGTAEAVPFPFVLEPSYSVSPLTHYDIVRTYI